MKNTPIEHATESKRTHRQMIGLRMERHEAEKCRAYAAADKRSAAQFALLMYLRGLKDFEAEQRKRGR